MATAINKTELMRVIRDEILNLKDSPLITFRQKEKNLPVIGEGSHEAKIMFIGEAPGRNEAKTGRPFCGAAGKLLDELLASINLPRTEVYITNIVKDRPPQNRDPLPEEIALYGPFLDRQIEIIKPAIIATLGRYAMFYIFNKFGVTKTETISQLHGQVVDITTTYGPIKIVPLYHPAAAIYNQHLKETLFDDFKVLKKI